MFPKNFRCDSDVNPERMIDCADVILEAGAKNPQGMTMSDLRTAVDERTSGRDRYTAEEIAAAMVFLFRLGVAVSKPAKW